MKATTGTPSGEVSLIIKLSSSDEKNEVSILVTKHFSMSLFDFLQVFSAGTLKSEVSSREITNDRRSGTQRYNLVKSVILLYP